MTEDIINEPIDTPQDKPGYSRAQLAPLMEQFLKRRKVKKIKRGKSGFSQAKMEADWGYSGGFR